MLQTLRERVKPVGFALVAEGYWKKKPDQDYLNFLGGTESEFESHAGNIERAEAMGFVPVWSVTANEDEWDAYEWAYSMSLENYVLENPADPDCGDILPRTRVWRRAYLEWGRTTLGFGLYLFRNS